MLEDLQDFNYTTVWAMYKVYGVGYAGRDHIPVPIDYIVVASDPEDALRKVRDLGCVGVHLHVQALPPSGQH
jgi:hypothetical protein